jgi:hypothetical protein
MAIVGSLVALGLVLGGCTGLVDSIASLGKTDKRASYADVTFDHAPHTDFDCLACHGEKPVEGQKLAGTELPAMKKCVACHSAEGDAPGECATCHGTVREETPPADHAVGWVGRHGGKSRFDDSCTWCHTDNGCDDCHTSTRPVSHTPTWNNSGHGREANFDRRQCDTCHQSDQCDRCHQVKPFTHFNAGFRFGSGHGELVERRGGTRSCRACHEPDFCASCHGG